jgi:hypothetical protein
MFRSANLRSWFDKLTTNGGVGSSFHGARADRAVKSRHSQAEFAAMFLEDRS